MLLTNFDEFVHYLYFLFFAQMLACFCYQEIQSKKEFLID